MQSTLRMKVPGQAITKARREREQERARRLYWQSRFLAVKGNHRAEMALLAEKRILDTKW